MSQYDSVPEITALGNLGPAAQEALSVLEQLNKNPDKYTREAASKAIQQIRGNATPAMR